MHDIYTAAAEQVVAESIKSITLQPLILLGQITTLLHIWSLWVRFDVLSPLRFTALPLQSLKCCSIFLKNRDTALTTFLFHSLGLKWSASAGLLEGSPSTNDCSGSEEIWYALREFPLRRDCFLLDLIPTWKKKDHLHLVILMTCWH